jgi:MoxR-like ATPase
LDEIFKANSAILNTLLTILNERKFDNAGGRETCPIRCVVGASNELPESDDLVALFDRFLIRKEVSPVSDEGVMALLELSNPGVPSCHSSSCNADRYQCETFGTSGLDGVIDSLTAVSVSVVMDRDAAELMRGLQTYLRAELSVQVSDRRLVKASRLLKICAASNGRSKVDPIDFFVLQHCFWNVPEERTPIRDWLWDHLTPGCTSVEQFRFLLESLRMEIVSVVQKTSGDISGQSKPRQSTMMLLFRRWKRVTKEEK